MENKMNNYEEEYHKEKHSHLFSNEEYYKIKARVSVMDYFYYPIHKYCKILEWGVGLGQNIYYFKEKDVIGYDVSKFAVEFCKQKGIRATTDLKNIKNNSFNIVFSSEVLEHLENPLEALKQMNKKLRKDGQLILVLPIDKWNKPNVNDKNQHLYNWNFNTITNLLVRAGFYPLDYKIIRRTGFYKLLPFSRISFKLYFFLTKLIAIVSGSKHMRIVSQKE